ncbi:YciI family protein [Sorangium sp. So ce131]|uniref:YciI family protein n=1 Tax=Sorangium sp. So ce131 TaxID=3133282 RepID=UPI003F628E65
MSEFLYLFRGGDRLSSPAEMQQHMQRWVVWIKELSEKGHVKQPGNPLEPTGKVVQGRQRTVVDGPFAEAKDLVGGYLLVHAKDLAHAVEISMGCPILETGGAVEVRPIMQK